MSGGSRCAAALLVLCSVLLLGWQSEAAGRGVHKLKLHDEAHSSRKYIKVSGGHDKKTGGTRSGDAIDHAATKKANQHGKKNGRRLQQATGVTTIVPGMSMCVTAADAAAYVTSAAGFLTVSNARWTAGVCDTASYGGAGTPGLGWGIVQSWPADHAMATVFPSRGALVLGSGDVTESQRVVNDQDGFTADNQLPGDADLDALIPGYTTYDATTLEFDVTPSKSGALVFQYVFASEEYNEYVDSPFNDVFGFFISPADKSTAPVNVAYLPDLVTPVSINNVNFHNYTQYYNDNDLEPRPTVFPPPSPFNTSYDGFTTLLNTRSYDVVAGATYHFKLSIADAGDHILDSAVWIAGGSLLVNNPPRVVTDGPYILQCPGTVQLHATGTDDDGDAIKYSWNLTSTTLPGVHIAKFTQDAALVLPDDAIPADVYDLHVSAIDIHGSRAISASTLTVLPCSAPEGNHAPTPGFIGAPYTLEVCNGVGSLTLDAGSSAESDPADSIRTFVWEISGEPDLELKLTGRTVTVTAAQGFFAGNIYEVEVFVQDSFGISAAAETTLTVVPTPGCNGGGGGGGGGGNPQVYTEAIISNGPYELACGGSVTLDGSLSTSFDGGALGFQWDFYDADTGAVLTVPASASNGGAVSMPDASYVISAATDASLTPGVTYSLTLNVVDSTNAWASDSTNFTVVSCPVDQPPTAVLAGGSTVKLPCGGSVTLDGTGSSDPEGAITEFTFNILDATGAIVASKTTSPPDSGVAVFDQAADGLAIGATYTVELIVTDAAGSTGSDTQGLKVTACNQPPVAVLSGGATLSLKCGGTTTIDGTASSDPDGNDDIAGYSFEVLDSAGKVVASKFSLDGKASLSQVNDKIPTSTSLTIKLTVSDTAGATNSATQTLSVGNCAPVAVLSPNPASVACGGSVTLSGASSSDSDGSVASYAWKLVYNTQTISQAASSSKTFTLGQLSNSLTSGATYAVTLTVKDNAGSSSSATGTLVVAAGCVAPPPPPPPPSPSPPPPPPAGPNCTGAVASVTTINVGTGATTAHTMVAVAVQGVVGSSVGIKITNVTQNEAGAASDTQMSGTWTCTDASLKNSNSTATVSAEFLNSKSTSATGRLYLISFKATDKNSLTCSGTVSVCVKTSAMASCNVTAAAASQFVSTTKAC